MLRFFVGYIDLPYVSGEPGLKLKHAEQATARQPLNLRWDFGAFKHTPPALPSTASEHGTDQSITRQRLPQPIHRESGSPSSLPYPFGFATFCRILWKSNLMSTSLNISTVSLRCPVSGNELHPILDHYDRKYLASEYEEMADETRKVRLHDGNLPSMSSTSGD
jgi:hypothetical protein